MATGRRASGVVVGATTMMLMHRHQGGPRVCRHNSAAATFALPITAQARALAGYRSGACVAEQQRLSGTGKLERFGGTPVFLQCAARDEPIAGTFCGVHGYDGPIFSLDHSHSRDVGLGMDAASDDGVFYVVGDVDDTANGRSGIFGMRLVPGTPRGTMTRRVATTPPGAETAGTRLEIVENRADRTVILFGAEDSEVAHRAVMGPTGLLEGPPERTSWPMHPRGFEVRSLREGRAPPRLRLLRANAAATPIDGIADDLGSFSPAVAQTDRVTVLFFAEGLAERTRIWGALLDVENARITARFRISTGELEAGSVYGDAYDGRIVVAWDQGEAAGHVVRIANVLCD